MLAPRELTEVRWVPSATVEDLMPALYEPVRGAPRHESSAVVGYGIDGLHDVCEAYSDFEQGSGGSAARRSERARRGRLQIADSPGSWPPSWPQTAAHDVRR